MMMDKFAYGSHGWMMPIHFVLSLLVLIGLILFIVWLVQVLTKKKQLLPWSLGMLAVGIIGSLLLVLLLGKGAWMDKDYDKLKKLKGFEMEEMMDLPPADELQENMMDEMMEEMEGMME